MDTIFPTSCLICKKEGKNLCTHCQQKITINKKFHCPDCKKTNYLGNYCSSCQTNYKLDGLWISSNYRNKILSTLIKKFKYSSNTALAPILGNIIISFIKNNHLFKKSSLLQNLDNLIFIPVPLHKRKHRQRGFNQSELLTNIVTKQFNITTNTKNLKRQKKTKPQAKLNKKQRLKNVQNAFIWTGENLNNKNIILIDDVSSTGATLNNCAKPLKIAGANNVWGLVLAKN